LEARWVQCLLPNRWPTDHWIIRSTSWAKPTQTIKDWSHNAPVDVFPATRATFLNGRAVRRPPTTAHVQVIIVLTYCADLPFSYFVSSADCGLKLNFFKYSSDSLSMKVGSCIQYIHNWLIVFESCSSTDRWLARSLVAFGTWFLEDSDLWIFSLSCFLCLLTAFSSSWGSHVRPPSFP